MLAACFGAARGVSSAHIPLYLSITLSRKDYLRKLQGLSRFLSAGIHHPLSRLTMRMVRNKESGRFGDGIGP